MLQKYYRIDECIGISIQLKAAGSMAIDACSVIRHHDKLDFDKKIPGMLTLAGIPRYFDVKFPLALNLTGKGVLHKQFEKGVEITDANFSKMLPSASLQEFYVQNFISGDQSFVSVIRKTDADKVIAQFTDMGYLVAQLSLGPFPLQNILPQLNIYEGDFAVNGHMIRRNEALEWTAFHYQEDTPAAFPIKVDTEPLDERLVIPYAAAFQLLLGDVIAPVQADLPHIKANYQKIISGKKARVAGLLILGLFFVALLINFLCFSWLIADNDALAVQLSLTARSSDEATRLNGRISSQEGFLKTLGWDKGVRKSIMIDQIAALLPPEITWRDMELNPVDLHGIRIQKTLVFQEQRIRISGLSQRIVPVNEWIARVRTLPHMADVQLESYVFNNELNTGQYTIVITYGNN